MKVHLSKCDGFLRGTAIGIAVFAVFWGILFLIFETNSASEMEKYSKIAMHVKENLERVRHEGKSAFVLGYTGEVGKALVQELNKAKAFKRVVLFGRRVVSLPDNVGPEFEQKVVDFDKLEESADSFSGLHVGFCALGTTRSKAGSAGFVKVDHDYVLKAAEVAKSKGCEHFNLVSSQGADKNSRFLYPQTKGQVEEALKVIHFQRLSIFRPAFLLCEREERRTVERAFYYLMKPVSYAFPTAITVPVEVVARAMVNNAVTPTAETVELFNNKAIHIMASNQSGSQAEASSKEK